MLARTEITSQTYIACGILLTVDHFLESPWHWNRFKFLLRCMRFDNYRNRPASQGNDRLAAIREAWKIFHSNMRNIYNPNEALTAYEKLVGYCGKIPG